MTDAASIGPEFRTLYRPKSTPLNRGRFRFLYVKPELRERVLVILDEQKLKPIALAKVAGVSKGLVSQWLKGTRKSMGFDAATKLHKRFGYEIAWLVNGDGAKTNGAAKAEPDRDLESPDVIRLVKAFAWLMEDEQEKLLAELEAKAATNKTIAKELGPRFRVKSDQEMLAHLVRGGDFPPGAKKKAIKGKRRQGFREEDPE